MGSSSSRPLISRPPLPCLPLSSAVAVLVARLLCTADRIRAFHIDLVLVSEVRVPGQLGSSKVSLVGWLPSPCSLHGRNRAKDPLDQMRALPSFIHSPKAPHTSNSIIDLEVWTICNTNTLKLTVCFTGVQVSGVFTWVFKHDELLKAKSHFTYFWWNPPSSTSRFQVLCVDFT